MAARLKTYAALKKQLDRVFSEWTRRRLADSRGMVRCVSCGTVKHWKEQQCGHFVTRARLATRWEPQNTAPQCVGCNMFKQGNAIGYSRWLLNRYGQSIFAELDELSRKPVKFSRADLAAMIEEYQGKLARLT